MISENFLKLRSAQKDKEFAQYQLEVYKKAFKDLGEKISESEWVDDVDLREHLDLL